MSTQVTQGTGTVRGPSMDGSQGTGTLRSALRSPNTTAKVSDRENRWTSRMEITSDESAPKFSFQEAENRHDDEAMESPVEDDDVSDSGSGTVVLHSPTEIFKHAALNQNVKPPSRNSSSEEVSISGTVVLHGKNDEPDTPPTSKPRLPIQDKASIISSEDSATNLAEARAALQGGLRKGSARERPLAIKKSKDSSENKMTERTTATESYRNQSEKIGEQKALKKSNQLNDDLTQRRASAAAASPALSLLILPSLKEATGNMSQGAAVTAVTDSLMDLEDQLPGSSEALIIKFLKRLQSSKDPSVKRLQELAVSIFTEKTETSQDSSGGKKQANAKLPEAQNLSPLARFLLTRWQSHVSQELNS
ncbi:germinal center kinase 1 [Canna indica]|uniref:Germinal center kinase 1 n=1 Tax=Canna indica TaxID=4628 RepID=A0AAQ3QFW2_9LILI|nr:germinal center kinase 1 [Canna indica]